MSLMKKIALVALFFATVSLYAVPQYTFKHNKILINSDTSLTINLSGVKSYELSQEIGYDLIDKHGNRYQSSSSFVVNGAKDITLQINDLPAGHYIELYSLNAKGKKDYMYIGNRKGDQLLSTNNNLKFGIVYIIDVNENKTFGSPVPGGFVALSICGGMAGVLWVRQRKSKTLLVSNV